MTDRNRLVVGTLPAQVVTFLSACFAFRSSETTFVSSKYIRRKIAEIRSSGNPGRTTFSISVRRKP